MPRTSVRTLFFKFCFMILFELLHFQICRKYSGQNMKYAILVYYGCCITLPQLWLKTKEINFLAVLEAVSQT